MLDTSDRLLRIPVRAHWGVPIDTNDCYMFYVCITYIWEEVLHFKGPVMVTWSLLDEVYPSVCGQVGDGIACWFVLYQSENWPDTPEKTTPIKQSV